LQDYANSPEETESHRNRCADNGSHLLRISSPALVHFVRSMYNLNSHVCQSCLLNKCLASSG